MQTILYITVFTSGITSLALEMLASRLLERHFGSSNLVWACIIGLILIYLAVGNLIGGRWADRSPSFRTFFTIQIWASVAVGLLPLISRPVLQAAADAFDKLQFGLLVGTFISVLILLVVPVILLGATSPFAIKLSIRQAQGIGRISGKIYAISTLGSFLGTFLPVLVLLPTVGVYRSFLVISALLMLVSLMGLWITVSLRAMLVYLWAPLLLIVILLWGLSGSDRNTAGMLYETESTYNYIQVVENNQLRVLRLNEGQGQHSVYHPTRLDYAGPWEMVLAAPYFNAEITPEQVKSLAIVGLAAGTTARQAAIVYPGIQIDGWEIDDKIVEVGRTYFDMNQPNLEVIIQDGRWGLEHSPNRYQIISIDAYRPPYIPWHLTTREFFQTVSAHLTPAGVMVINVGRAASDRRLIEALYATISTVFPSVYVVDIPRTFNSIIYASQQPTRFDAFASNAGKIQARKDLNPLLNHVMQVVLANIQPEPQPGQVLTDDFAPVEGIVNDMVVRFILGGNTESLK